MPTRIVTHAYRPKRPPRKRKAAPAVAIVTRATRRTPEDTPPASDTPEPTPTPANDDTPAAPAPPAARSAVVSATSRKRSKHLRPELPDDPEADAAMRAWLERAKWGGGPER
jgi:hypothetical protein